ncbi:pentapeptide repeat-containing protein [Ktedonobacteria bacterium brp13]|nr:pentapeptide repeat-containing protein [Ktedonobacteria bacterium brp13]
MNVPKRNLWKIGIAIAIVLLLLMLMIWIPLSAGQVNETAQSERVPATGTATIQRTPAPDLTVTALAKDQLKQQDDKLQRENSGIWPYLNAIGGSLGTIFVATAALIAAVLGFRQWRGNRLDEREKRDEERFQRVVEGLGSASKAAQAGAAIMLRTFLQPGYEQFYQQSFDLAVTHLRLRHVDPNTLAPLDPDEYVPLDSLSQALITVFKESFPLARKILGQRKSQKESFPLACKILGQRKSQFDTQSLDASHVRLDSAYLDESDLKDVWMRVASLRRARLRGAKLSGANLRRADLSRAFLDGAFLDGANLSRAHLSGAHLSGADLSRADLSRADLSGTHPENARSLQDADLRRAKGLTEEQREACKAKGAIIDEAPMPSTPQLPVVPSPPSPSDDTQDPSAQASTLPPDSNENSTASSQQDPES